MGFFCLLRRAKRKLGGGGVSTRAKREKGSNIKAKKVSRKTLNYTLKLFLGK